MSDKQKSMNIRTDERKRYTFLDSCADWACYTPPYCHISLTNKWIITILIPDIDSQQPWFLLNHSFYTFCINKFQSRCKRQGNSQQNTVHMMEAHGSDNTTLVFTANQQTTWQTTSCPSASELAERHCPFKGLSPRMPLTHTVTSNQAWLDKHTQGEDWGTTRLKPNLK